MCGTDSALFAPRQIREMDLQHLGREASAHRDPSSRSKASCPTRAYGCAAQEPENLCMEWHGGLAMRFTT